MLPPERMFPTVRRCSTADRRRKRLHLFRVLVFVPDDFPGHEVLANPARAIAVPKDVVADQDDPTVMVFHVLVVIQLCHVVVFVDA